MPRQARQKSSTGIYHLMLRGINKKDIFYDVEDRQQFLHTLKRFRGPCEYKIYGYCLMNNHIHLLIEEGKEPISKTMQRIGISYVYWYNKKYGRVGHLFQDRFRSEAVEDDGYLLAVLNYIHQNPLRAGMVGAVHEYEWSSYNDYVNGDVSLTDVGFILAMLSRNRGTATRMFREYSKKEDTVIGITNGIRGRQRVSDQDAAGLIRQQVESDDVSALCRMPREERDTAIRELKKQGISIRQMARITGLGRRIIEKA